VVPLPLAQLTRATLTGLGYAVSWQEYPMAHSVCLPELRAIGTWLSTCLGA